MSSIGGTKYPSLAGEREVSHFAKRDTLMSSAKAGAVGAFFGLNVVLVKNSLGPSRTLLGGLRGSMAPVATYALIGASYTFAEAVSANLRGEETAANAFAGGAAAGAIAGASLRGSIAKSVGGAVILGSVAATFEWGFNRGHKQSILGSDTVNVPITEEHPRQGFWELVQRRPLSQTIEELGDLAKQFVRD